MRSVKFAAVLTAVIAAGALAGPASAATVRVTPQLQGAGDVQRQTGPTTFTSICTNTNTDDRVTKTDCTQIVFTNDFVSQVSMTVRAVAPSSPTGHWVFTGWGPGVCGSFTPQGDCVMTSPLFGEANFAPKAFFDDVGFPGLDVSPAATYSDIAERTVTISFAWNEPVDAGCRFDGGGTVFACTSGVTPFELSEGAHTVQVRASDKSGNLSNFSSPLSLTIVDTAITGGPANGGVTGPNVLFNYGTFAGISFECSLDGAAYSVCGAGPSASNPYNGLSTGSHTFLVRARNGGFFDHISASRTWTVDATPPETSVTSGPPSKTKLKTATINFEANEPVGSFACSLDGAAEAGCFPALNLTGLGEGTHLLTVRATDVFGNVDATPATFSWTVDSLPPQTTISKGPAATTKATKAAFKFTASEPNSTFQCKLDKKAWKTCKSGVSYKSLKKGKHTFQVRASDALTNQDTSPAKKIWRVT